MTETTARRGHDRFDFGGARALVTGASSGIGRATAVALAAHGAQVAVAARRRDLLEDLVSEVQAAGHRPPIVFQSDLSHPDAADALARDALAELGGLDLLVNNAAMHCLRPLVDMDRNTARAMYETNVWSPLHLSLDLLGALRESSRGGAIANVTSSAGYMWTNLHGIYGSSKSAAAALTQILRLELAHEGVTVTEVVPGPVDTAMLDISRRAPFAARALKVMPPGTPAGMANAILQAVERRRGRVFYPWHTKPPVVLPELGRWAMRIIAGRNGMAGFSEGLS